MRGNQFYEFGPRYAGAGWSGFYGRKLAECLDPTNTLWMGEWSSRWNCEERIDYSLMDYPVPPPVVTYESYMGTSRLHGEGSNWLFCDGHVQRLTGRETLFPRNLWSIFDDD